MKFRFSADRKINEAEQERHIHIMEEEMVKALEAYPPLLDVKHLMAIFMIGENVAYDEMNSGKFPVMKVGKQKRVAKPLLAKYIIESSCGTE
ncbi:DNA-binding protein [Paenibacillus sp. Aloe-11]|uniref:DNA-binding protein n=1 Tax=Paenibacillus sp. Aloe-11 TaxID=1050222 RepID=UPI001E3C3F15|nr:DNA-binding protein [Paenibacillus sp. Aloe-11]